MLSYSNEDNKLRYGKLQQNGFDVIVLVKSAGYRYHIQGVKSRWSVEELCWKIFQQTSIHPELQRLFVGGEEMDLSKSLSQYIQIQPEVTIEMVCSTSLLISSLDCPGPMLTEIDVHPYFDESVASIKRKIRDKFRIETSRQRLHVHPTEMTTLNRRRQLDDSRLLSNYLASYASGNFLELIVLPNESTENDLSPCKMLYIRAPMSVSDSRSKTLRRFGSVNSLDHQNGNLNGALWITIPVNINSIIRRDPKVNDVLKLVTQAVTDTFSLNLPKQISLRFTDRKPALARTQLQENLAIYEDYHVRAEEMLLFIDDKDLKHSINTSQGVLSDCDQDQTLCTVSPELHEPLPPLQDYCDEEVRYTMPTDPYLFKWDIKSSTPLDKGASPGVDMEVSAISFSKCYGSWDIPEHRKTFVEVTLEGVIRTGDIALKEHLCKGSAEDLSDYDVKNIIRASTDEMNKDHVVLYVLDSTEITIFGPSNKKESGQRRHFSTIPHNPSTSWAKSRRRHYNAVQTMRKGALGSKTLLTPSPLHLKPSDSCITMTTPVDSPLNPSFEGRRTLNETEFNNWYLTRERISDISLPTVISNTSRRLTTPLKSFATTCGRGVSIDGRPYINVLYERRGEVTDDPTTFAVPNNPIIDAYRTAFDFRIQVQMMICHANDDDTSASNPQNAELKIKVEQKVSRIEHVKNFPCDKYQYKSPAKLEKVLRVSLASSRWRIDSGLDDLPIIDLNK